MRRFFRYLVRGLVLFVIFMASALTAMRFAIHGRQTTIPKVRSAWRRFRPNGYSLITGFRWSRTTASSAPTFPKAASCRKRHRRA